MSRLIIPSFKSGYAHNAAEARYPSLWKGLVGHWAPTLGPTGLTLRDVSGYQNHGTLTNMDPATDWVPTEKGQALIFDNGAHTDGVDILPNWTMNFGQGISIVMLLQPTDFRYEYYAFYAKNGAAGDALVIQGGAARNQVRFVAMSAWAVKTCDSNAGDDIEDGYFHSVVGVVSSAETAIWVDGRKQSDVEAGLTGEASFTVDTVSIGKVVGSFEGKIANVSLYNRVLTPNEIQLLYEQPHALTMRRPRQWVVPAAGVARSKVGSSLAHGRRGLVA